MPDAASIGVSDPDSTSFTFTVSNVSHGTFETTADGDQLGAATTFTTADLNAGHVRFLHDGGEDAPTFSIQADDGAGINSLSNVFAGASPSPMSTTRRQSMPPDACGGGRGYSQPGGANGRHAIRRQVL